MQASPTATLIKPAWVFFGVLFFDQFISSLYALHAIDPPWTYYALSELAYIWLMWWWLRADGKRYGSAWPLDLGFFLSIGWIILIPYHLFKTRGAKAFLPILFFILIWLCASVAAAVVWAFLM